VYHLYIGKDIPRIDGIEKVTGKAAYLDDIYFSDMLYAKILRSPYPHAHILNIDTSEAEKLPGVKAVLTYKDVPKIPFNSSYRGPFHAYYPFDEYVLEDKVRFIGDKVAAVAADDPLIAEEALNLIKVEYKPLPAVFDPEEAMKPGAPQIHPKVSERNIISEWTIGWGDIEQGFKGANYVFEGKYKTHRVTHCCMETHGCIAKYDVNKNELTVWSTTQVPFNVRRVLSIVLGLPVTKIRVIKTVIGGGFGSKDEVFDEPLCALLSRKAGGRPVKVYYDRYEEFIATRTRHPAIYNLKSGVTKDGRITSLYVRAILDGGAYATASPQILRVNATYFMNLYRYDNFKFDGYAVYTNHVPSGAMRGYGAPQAHFALESHINEICQELGFDPVEFRLKNIRRSGDKVPVYGEIVGCMLEECIKVGAEKIGWYDLKGKKEKDVGIGVALHTHTTGPPPRIAPDQSTAMVSVNEDGTVTVISPIVDVGTGTLTAVVKVVADEIGVPIERVKLVEADTSFELFDYGTFADRANFNGVNAARLAAREAKQQVLKKASEMLGSPIEKLEIINGIIRERDSPQKTISLEEVARSIYFETGRPIIGIGSFKPEVNPMAWGATFVILKVDRRTGKVHISKIISVHDVTKAISPEEVRGQIRGAVAWGVSFSLFEELITRNGRVTNPTFRDYRICRSLDIPEIEPVIVETNINRPELFVKGVGQNALISITPAVAAALYDAVGIRIRETPLTPEKIWRALRDKGFVEEG